MSFPYAIHSIQPASTHLEDRDLKSIGPTQRINGLFDSGERESICKCTTVQNSIIYTESEIEWQNVSRYDCGENPQWHLKMEPPVFQLFKLILLDKSDMLSLLQELTLLAMLKQIPIDQVLQGHVPQLSPLV